MDNNQSELQLLDQAMSLHELMGCGCRSFPCNCGAVNAFYDRCGKPLSPIVTEPGQVGGPGKSAFEVWLAAGHTGTVLDFLTYLRGQKGDPGSSLVYGFGAPTSQIGRDNDTYIDRETWVLYGPKTAGLWTTSISLKGGAGAPGKSAYELWQAAGNSGTVADYLLSIKGQPGNPGKSAYELWQAAGNTGTLTDYLNAIKGAPGNNGKSAYELWQAAGNAGNMADYLNAIKGQPGSPGKSAFEIWQAAGNTGSLADYMNSIKGGPGNAGKSAYELWQAAGNTGSLADFMASLKGNPGGAGKSAYQQWLELGNTGSQTDFFNSLKGPKGDDGAPGDSEGVTTVPEIPSNARNVFTDPLLPAN